MFNLNNNCNYGFRLFVTQNFPFIEKDFDALSDYEILCKIFEYFDKQIKAVDEKYSGIGDEVESLKEQFEQLKVDINTILNNFETNIKNDVEIRLQQNYNQVVQLLAEYQTIVNNSINQLRTDLESEIERIELGDVKAYNPTNGEVENISKVIMDVYEILRQNAISCTEFDGLELTATEFDNKEITAYNFDVNGKVMLIPA